MQYFGAAHYYFWKGIEKAQNGPGLDFDEELESLDGFDTNASYECREAFIWGYYLGLEIDKVEYKKLTAKPKRAKIKKQLVKKVKKKPKKEEPDIMEREWPVKGNC